MAEKKTTPQKKKTAKKAPAKKAASSKKSTTAKKATKQKATTKKAPAKKAPAKKVEASKKQANKTVSKTTTTTTEGKYSVTLGDEAFAKKNTNTNGWVNTSTEVISIDIEEPFVEFVSASKISPVKKKRSFFQKLFGIRSK